MSRVRRGTEVRPVGVLELCNLAHTFERLIVVGQCKLAYDDVGLVGCRRRGSRIVLRVGEEGSLWL
jgi:hypothetical protein